MSNIQTGAERMPHDLSHLGFLAGQIGRLITISTTPVIAGDSFEMDAVGALRLSPLRRGLAIDSTVDIFTFYVLDKLLDLVGLGGKSAADKGKDTRDYLAAAFPELNAWERAGADASSAGMVDAGFENQKELTKMQLDNQKEIAEMQNETQKEIAGIQSATSRQNTKDQVYAQNEMLAYQQKESTARVASIMENTNLSKQQQVSEIMRQMLTQ